MTSWAVGRFTGPASEVHGRDLPDRPVRAVSVVTVDRPALVLGSTQPDAVVDQEAATRAGVEVVRRRSGGGAVLLRPDEALWVDLVVPADDPLWEPDVARAFGWVGDAWAGALADVGVTGATVHRGPLQRTGWSDLVCFAGLGPGEVTVAGAKAVGVAQRRARAGARFQCAVPRRWDPDALLGLLALAPGHRRAGAAELARTVHPVGAAADVLADALVARLPSAPTVSGRQR